MSSKNTAVEKASGKKPGTDILGIALRVSGAVTQKVVADHAVGDVSTLEKLKAIVPERVSGKSLGMDILGTALQLGGAITQMIVADQAAGNVSTLDKLKVILPEKDVLLAQAQALKLKEREKTREALEAARDEEE
jgi:hypothetical protein